MVWSVPEGEAAGRLRLTFSQRWLLLLLLFFLFCVSFSFFPPSDLLLPHLEKEDLFLLLVEFCQQVRIDVHVR